MSQNGTILPNLIDFKKSLCLTLEEKMDSDVSPDHRELIKRCQVVLERLPTSATPSGVEDNRCQTAPVALRDCRVVLERLPEDKEFIRTLQIPQRKCEPTESKTVLRRTLRERKPKLPFGVGLDRGRRSTRHSQPKDRERWLFYQQTALEVTQRSCQRRGRARPTRASGAAGTSSTETPEATPIPLASVKVPDDATQDQNEDPGDPGSALLRLRCFSEMIKMLVQQTGEYADVLAGYEKTVLGHWLDLSEDATAVYIRLLGFAGPWTKGKALVTTYPQVQQHFAALERAGFVSSSFSQSEIRSIVTLVRVDQLEEVGRKLGIATKRRTKLALQRALVKLYASGPSQEKFVQDTLRAALGGCVRVLETPRELVERCLMMLSAWLPGPFDGDRLQATRSLLLRPTPRLLVPEDRCTPSATRQLHRCMFTTREQAVEWEKVVLDRRALSEAIKCGKLKDVKDLGDELLKKLRRLNVGNAHNVNGVAARVYGAAVAEALTAASQALRREEDLQASAVEMLTTLLEQRQHGQEARALWAVSLAGLLQTVLDDHEGAAEVLVRELEDEGHRAAHRCSLEDRARALLRAGAGRIQGPAQVRLKDLTPEQTAPPSNTLVIRSTSLAGKTPSMKRVFVHKPTGMDTAYLSVEERAMVHLEAEFPEGVDDEGETLVSLAVLALWGSVYDADVPDAWGTPCQDRPTDWGTPRFWEARSEGMERRLEAMLQHADDVAVLAAELRQAVKMRRGTPSLVRWDLLDGLDIEELLTCMTVPIFVAICRRFFVDFGSHRQGFPDLLLWNKEESKSLFVEVKGPGDALSQPQCKWLEFLRKEGAHVTVAMVRAR